MDEQVTANSKKSTESLSKTHKSARTRYRIKLYLVFMIGCALLIVGSISVLKQHRATTGEAALPQADYVVNDDTRSPDEAKPNSDAYIVPADQPRKIVLPSIAADGLIQRVGTTKDSAIAAPTNVHFGGWYVQSVKPGEEGLSIIDGHVSGKYSDGIFKNLHKLQPNDTIHIEFGDKSIKYFEVVEVKTLPVNESASFLLTKNSAINKQLNLITCGGDYNASTETYSERVIVVTKAKE